jgi:hypothetical protein
VRVFEVGVPHRLRGGGAVLDLGPEEPDHGRPVRAVDLELDELVAVDPHRPAGVDLGDHAAVELEDAVRGVFGGRRVALALLVPALGDVRRGLRVDALHGAEQIL